MDFSELPASWPPEEGGGTRVLPIFPLPNVWLFPGAIMPLNIFEPRYVQMIEDCLDGPGRFVLGTILGGHEAESLGTPPFGDVAGFGEIGRHDRQDDGRYHIVLVGLGRVRVEEVESDRLYRKVRAQGLFEVGMGADDEDVLRVRLIEAIRRRTKLAMPGQPLPPIPPDVPLGRLADLLSLRMPLTYEAIEQLYAELDVRERALFALRQDELRPNIPPPQPPPGSGGPPAPPGPPAL
ncbi:MAG: LON peptidase substrate-binding domain-containing protein [Planctomycetota bacterium]|nr:LON peptidase substrate-binding domain-containing protein [Planctomycetota bacterium]